ncbi:MAG: hypothetical protein ACRDA5_04805 [Clostridium sp.]
MVNAKNPNIVICSKCGNESVVCNEEKFVLCTQCKSIKRINSSKIED